MTKRLYEVHDTRVDYYSPNLNSSNALVWLSFVKDVDSFPFRG